MSLFGIEDKGTARRNLLGTRWVKLRLLFE